MFKSTTTILSSPRHKLVRLVTFVRENKIPFSDNKLRGIGKTLELPSLEIDEALLRIHEYVIDPKINNKVNNQFVLKHVILDKMESMGKGETITRSDFNHFVNVANQLSLSVFDIDRELKEYARRKEESKNSSGISPSNIFSNILNART